MMKAFLSLLLLLAFFGELAGGMLALPQVARAEAAITYLQSTSIVATQSTFNFTSENFGTAISDRVLIAVVRGFPFNPGDDLVSSATIGGVSATIHVNTFDPDAGTNIAIISAPVPTGTSGTVSITYAGNNTAVRMSLYRATGIGTGATAYDTDTNLDDVVSMSINVPSGGILVAGGNFEGNGAITTVGVTEDDDTTLSTSRVVSGSAGPLSAQTGRTVSFDGTAGNAGGGAVSWASSGGTLSKPPNNLGLVGYWSFNEGNGTVATDFSGNERHGTLTGAPVWASGKRGASLYFDGSGERVVAPGGGSLQTTGNLTVSAWVYADAFDADDGIVDKASSFGFSAFDGGNYQLCVDGATSGCTESNTPLTTGRWLHIAAVYNITGDIDVYLNGALNNGSGSGVIPTSRNNNSNSVIVSDATNTFNGRIDEVRVYSRALTASEIAALYGAGAIQIAANSKTLTAGSTLRNGLVGHWSMDGGDTNWTSATAGTVADGSGTGNTGTITNMVRTSAVAIGKLGQAFSFDGSDDYLQVADHASLDITADISMAAWIKRDVIGTFDGIISKTDGAEWAYEMYICGTGSGCTTGGNTDKLTFESSNTGREFSTGTIADTEWHHVAITRSGSTFTFYIDGAQSGTSSDGTALSSTADPLYIGTDDTEVSAVWYFDGFLDDVRIYNRALSATEVSQLYRLGQATLTQ